MADEKAIRRKELREELAELRNAALANLEARGYDVRDKSPIQIRRMLRRRRRPPKGNVQTNHALPMDETLRRDMASAEDQRRR